MGGRKCSLFASHAVPAPLPFPLPPSSSFLASSAPPARLGVALKDCDPALKGAGLWDCCKNGPWSNNDIDNGWFTWDLLRDGCCTDDACRAAADADPDREFYA